MEEDRKVKIEDKRSRVFRIHTKQKKYSNFDEEETWNYTVSIILYDEDEEWIKKLSSIEL